MTIDKLSQRILAISFGLTAILLSLSLVIFATNQTGTVKAEDFETLRNTSEWDSELRGGVGLGTVDGTGYFIVWAKPNTLYKVDLKKATDWYSE